MAAVQFNDAERAAMRGLPWFVRALYFEMRARMDYATGLVGSRKGAGVSWQTFMEALYVEPHQGETESGTPDKNRVRRAAGRLEREGLVVNMSKPKKLILKLQLATTDSSAPNKPDTNPTQTRHNKQDTIPDTSDASSGAGFDDIPDTKADTPYTQGFCEEFEKPDTPPVSGIRISHTAAHGSVTDIACVRDRKEKARRLAGVLSQSDVLVTSESVALLSWVDRGLSLDFLLECLAIAKRKKPGQAIPVNFLDCFVNDQLSGGMHGVPAWAQIPKDDNRLWDWARLHGYSNPGQRTHAQYRALLRSEVEKRALLFEREEVE